VVWSSNLNVQIRCIQNAYLINSFMTRLEAIAAGNKVYTGKKCSKCKSSKRYVSSFGCVKCSKGANLWKLYDPDVIGKYQSPERDKQRLQRWRQNNPDKYQAQWDRGNKKRKRHYENNRDEYRNRNLLKNYGISLEQYNQILKSQNGKCAICKKPELTTNKRNLAVDHNHKTGRVRGLLCKGCNVGLGEFNENINTLKLAIQYLQVNV
jgi:Recombination endonuclease VII